MAHHPTMFLNHREAVAQYSHATPYWALMFLLPMLFGCSGNSTNGTSANPPVPDAREPIHAISPQKPATLASVKAGLHSGTPLSDEECQAFAQKLVNLICAGQVRGAQSLVDSNAFLDIAFAGLDQSERDRALLQVFRDAYLKGIEENNGFKTLSNLVQNGAALKFLNVRHEGNDVAVILRVTVEPNGFDYHKLELARRAAGIRVVDIFVMRQGEWSSTNTRHIAQLGLFFDRERMGEKLEPEENAALRSMPIIKSMAEDMAAGRYQANLDKYDLLPEELKSDMTLLAFRLESAKRTNPDLYQQVAKDIRRIKPSEPAIDVMCLDAFVLQKNFDEAHACLDRIDQAIGPDPFLLVLHADYFFQAGDLKAAKSTAEKALAADSSFIGALWLLVHISIQEKDFATTCRVLERLKNEHKVELTSVLTLDTYAEFIESQDYKAWTKTSNGMPSEPMK